MAKAHLSQLLGLITYKRAVHSHRHRRGHLDHIVRHHTLPLKQQSSTLGDDQVLIAADAPLYMLHVTNLNLYMQAR